MAKFLITPTSYNEKVITARLGGNASNTRATDADVGKWVKLSGESNYTLVSSAEAIEGVITSIESSVYDGYHIGGVQVKGYIEAIANGAQVDNLGAITIGDYVLATAPTAIQVEDSTPRKVVKATSQVNAKAAPFKARVVSLGKAGTGAVGTNIVIELL